MSGAKLWREKITHLQAEQRALQLQKQQQVEHLKQARNELAVVKQAQEVAQDVAEQVQRQAYGSIAAIVTRCLQQVWGDDAYEFAIDVKQKRGKTEAQIRLSRGGLDIEDLTSACGGGVIDVVAFALRMAALQLARPQRRKLLVLDEPMRFVSKQLRPAVAAMMKAIANELDVQIIMVTHIEEFEIGKVICLGEEGPF